MLLIYTIHSSSHILVICNEALITCVLCVTVVEYKIGDMGYIRYYLAPKIEDGEEAA